MVVALAGAFIGLINPKLVGLADWSRFRVFISGIGLMVVFFFLFSFTYDPSKPPGYDDMTVEERVNFEVEKVARKRDQAEKAAAVRAASVKPKAVVYNSAWDGSVQQVEDYLKLHLKDPDSLDPIEWSPVIETEDGFVVRVKYRANNSFGGKVIEHQLFKLSPGGTVLSVASLK